MAGEGHGSGAAHQSAAATTSAGERSMAGGSGAAQQAATPSAAAGDRSMPGEEHGSGAAPQSAAVTPCRAALAISRTWPWMTEASSKYLAAEVEAGRCREIEEEVWTTRRRPSCMAPSSRATSRCAAARTCAASQRALLYIFGGALGGRAANTDRLCGDGQRDRHGAKETY